jgi:hypothetical protein
MSHNRLYLNNLLLLLISIMVLSGCAPLIQREVAIETTPTLDVPVEEDGVEESNLFVDLTAFQTNLLQALNTRDPEKLQMWMTEPFLNGTWRGDLSDTSPEDALNLLFTDQLGAETPLTPVKDADLQTLMGGTEPLSIPLSEAGVEDAFLASGWGKDGSDEAILFVLSLRFHLGQLYEWFGFG